MGILNDSVGPHDVAVQSVRHRDVKEVLVKVAGQRSVGRTFQIHENVPLPRWPTRRQIGELELVTVKQYRVEVRQIRVAPVVRRVTIVYGTIVEYVALAHVKCLVAEHGVPEQDLLRRVPHSRVAIDDPPEVEDVVDPAVEIEGQNVEGEREDRDDDQADFHEYP